MTNIKNADLPATPLVNQNGHPYHASQVCFDNNPLCSGMSKREAFAMAAMQGLLSNSEPKSWSDSQYYDQISKQAVNHADKLLKELSL
jgi:hypothetical protein